MDAERLKSQKTNLKAQVTKLMNRIQQNPDMSVAEVKVRLRRLDEYRVSFEDIQAKIAEALDAVGDGEMQAENNTESDEFEEKYIAAAAMIQEIIDKSENIQQPRNAPNANRNQRVIIRDNEIQYRGIKLPDIKLLEFDGDYSKWMAFKNSFETTIDGDATLTQMQKHQYLIGVLHGEARKVIEGYEISNENYENAWQLLKDTYDNKNMLIENHLDQLFKIPSISKEDKAESMRKLIWHIQTHLTSLKTLKQPVDHWDTLIIHLAKKQLDYLEQRDWQNQIKDRTEANMPKLSEFIKFLTDRSHTLRMLNQNKSKGLNSKQAQSTKPEKKQDKKVTLVSTISNCKYCAENHPVNRCEEFLKLSSEERRQSVIKKKLCLNCLNPGHMAQNCRNSFCKKCGERHNTLLHKEKNPNAENKEHQSSTVKSQNSNSAASTSVAMCCTQKRGTRIILSTVQIYVQDKEGKLVVCRALLDSGSQSNLITSKLVKRLDLSCSGESKSVSGVNQVKVDAKKVQIKIKAVHNDFVAEIECLALPAITEEIPQTKINSELICIPKNTQLADPIYDKPGKVDVLIGAGLYWKILIGSPRNRIKGQPALQNTKLGWILGGEISEEPGKTPTCLTVTNTQLSEQLEKFWKQESISKEHYYTKEEKLCEQYFKQTSQRNPDGRFIVRLPTRSNVALGESKGLALTRLKFLEKRLNRNSELKTAYCEFMKDYEKRGHMTSMDNLNNIKADSYYYIPHQAVVRPDSVTTKLRVVFDASAKTSLHTSLNDKLMPGPNLQNDLSKIIMRFRAHQYVLTADIEKMFRQILVHSEDRLLQLILWRKDTTEDPHIYKLNTVTYGTVSAPYLSMRCLRELASLHKEEFPLAAKAVEEDFYMDDVLTGGNTIQEAIQLQMQLTTLLMRGQLPLRKWRSNDLQILSHFLDQNTANNLLIMDKEEALKTLGLLWNAADDTLQYKVDLPKITILSKRNVLSMIATIFDPLGLIAPVLIRGKMFMQLLWNKELQWDQPLSEELIVIWNEYYSSLPYLNNIKIPRNVNPGNEAVKFDLFGFGDASERAIGACIYVVSTDIHGNKHSKLLCAKSRVAPIKKISLPRLELEAAKLLAQLLHSTEEAFRAKIQNVKLWSDSTIVIGWLQNESRLFKTFVANRVTKIQELTEHATWDHVPSAENPADLISRGTSVDNLANSSLWWHGPDWLRSDKQCPAHRSRPDTILPELKNISVTLAVLFTSKLLHRYSSYSKLLRIIAYCYRFKLAITKNKETGPIKPSELDKAEIIVIRWLQHEEFPVELQLLKEGRELSRKSPLRSLCPIIDSNGLIRVGGRLRNANIADENKHQILLPARNHITTVIMREEHQRNKHCPPEQLRHIMRRRYWPISGRRETRKIVKQCIRCFHFRPTLPDVMMGDLPNERVKPVDRAFTVTGVDYAGPVQIRESKRRGRIHISKGYVAVFVCFSTKAIHLELVMDLTTESFLAALSRFTARRGNCSHLFSDNGTNFVGASRKLEEVFEFLSKNQPQIASHLAKQKINWSFIPPRSPHFGGLWEAAVKSMKRQFYTITQGKAFTYEETDTLLVEIEASLNSRPLTPLTNDPNDFQVLTPAHFLISDSLMQPAEYNLLNVSDNRLSRWQHLQKLRQQLWNRWQREYLQELQKRVKWSSPGENIELNRIVLLIEEDVPPLHWPLGRVIELHPGKDGQTRVVTVRTQNGIYKRAVKKLCLLPTADEDKPKN